MATNVVKIQFFEEHMDTGRLFGLLEERATSLSSNQLTSSEFDNEVSEEIVQEMLEMPTLLVDEIPSYQMPMGTCPKTFQDSRPTPMESFEEAYCNSIQNLAKAELITIAGSLAPAVEEISAPDSQYSSQFSFECMSSYQYLRTNSLNEEMVDLNNKSVHNINQNLPRIYQKNTNSEQITVPFTGERGSVPSPRLGFPPAGINDDHVQASKLLPEECGKLASTVLSLKKCESLNDFLLKEEQTATVVGYDFVNAIEQNMMESSVKRKNPPLLVSSSQHHIKVSESELKGNATLTLSEEFYSSIKQAARQLPRERDILSCELSISQQHLSLDDSGPTDNPIVNLHPSDSHSVGLRTSTDINSSTCDENHWSRNQVTDCEHPGAALSKCDQIRMKQACSSAKRYLLNAGWKTDSQICTQSSTTTFDAMYVSPSGSRIFSLASTCGVIKNCKGVYVSLERGINKQICLLNAYDMTKTVVMDICSDRHVCDTFQHLNENMENSGYAYNTNEYEEKMLADNRMQEIMSEMSNRACTFNNQNKRKYVACERNFMVGPKRRRARPPLKKGCKSSHGQGYCRMQVLLSIPEGVNKPSRSFATKDTCPFKKSDLLSWLIDKGVLKANDCAMYINNMDGHVMKKGHSSQEGIVCDCCKDVYTLSTFEVSAGSKLQKPIHNIVLDDGRSISDRQFEAYAVQDAKQKDGGFKDTSDDICGICGDGGELILCDHCPSTFHLNCVGLVVLPEGDWYCSRCTCDICGNSLRACDPKNSMLQCTQCELPYHITCTRTYSMHASCLANCGTWFCSKECEKVFNSLRGLLGIMNPLENGLSWTLLKSIDKEQTVSTNCLQLMADNHSKLSVAHCVMQECFVPMIDPHTKTDLISQALYNRRSNIARLNYSGFYTMVLERGDEIISVATIRVHGAKLAEMPLVGTKYKHRRQGMCRHLMNALEEMLRALGVEKLILPAVAELLDTWLDGFSFQHMSRSETQEINKFCLMTFPGTTLLQKHLNPLPGRVKQLPRLKQSTFKSVNELLRAQNRVVPEQSSCKSVEEFLAMARASLDNGVVESSIPLMNNAARGQFGKSICDSSCLNSTATTVLPKHKIEYKTDFGCPYEADMEQKDDMYSKVVLGRTRSKRLIKSRRWVAEGLSELIDSRRFNN